MPLEMSSSSLAPVQTCWPFLPTTVAVPVSWQVGSSKLAAISALRRKARATPLSLGEASGSERILATCSLCSGRSRKETSRMASRASRVSADGSTLRISLPSKVATETPSLVTRRYLVWSFASGKGSWYWKAGVAMAAGLLSVGGVGIRKRVKGNHSAGPLSTRECGGTEAAWARRGRRGTGRTTAPGAGLTRPAVTGRVRSALRLSAGPAGHLAPGAPCPDRLRLAPGARDPGGLGLSRLRLLKCGGPLRHFLLGPGHRLARPGGGLLALAANRAGHGLGPLGDGLAGLVHLGGRPGDDALCLGGEALANLLGLLRQVLHQGRLHRGRGLVAAHVSSPLVR